MHSSESLKWSVGHHTTGAICGFAFDCFIEKRSLIGFIFSHASEKLLVIWQPEQNLALNATAAGLLTILQNC